MTPETGINVAGYFRAELGLGESGRLFLAAAEAAGERVATFSFSQTLNRQEHAFEDVGVRAAPYDLNVFCVNGDKVRDLTSELGPLLKDRYTVGLWAWELEEFPPYMRDGFAFVDEVWAISHFSASAISTVCPKPVYVLPPAIVVPESIEPADRASFGLPAEGFVFLFIFDFHSTLARKNPLGLIRAFRKAFAPGKGPILVIKSINGHRVPKELKRLRSAVEKAPDVYLLEDYLAPARRTSLIALCDCYVSMHRSEGFGLTMAEAMALQKPVIATGYSGNLEFMNPDNSFLLAYRLVRIRAGSGPYQRGARWAEPDVDEAARLMRTVVDDPDVAAERAARGYADVRTHHSIANRASVLRARLQDLRAGDRNTQVRRRLEQVNFHPPPGRAAL